MINPTSIVIEYPLSWQIAVIVFQYLLIFDLAIFLYWVIPISGFRVFVSIIPLGIGFAAGWLSWMAWGLIVVLYSLLFWRELYSKEEVKED